GAAVSLQVEECGHEPPHRRAGKRKTSLNSREVIQRGRNREEAVIVVMEACYSTSTASQSLRFHPICQAFSQKKFGKNWLVSWCPVSPQTASRRAGPTCPPAHFSTASAAMAALSVQNASGGMNSSTFSSAAMRSSAARRERLAATPPPTASLRWPVRRSA